MTEFLVKTPEELAEVLEGHTVVKVRRERIKDDPNWSDREWNTDWAVIELDNGTTLTLLDGDGNLPIIGVEVAEVHA